jgi:hypothetical protein
VRVKDEADSTALDALFEIRNDWGVSKISGMFQTASQRGTILELSPGGVYSAKKTPAQKLSVAERLANRKVTPHPNSEEGRCLLKSFVSTTNEEDVQFAGKSSSSPLSNTTGSGLVELATDGKEIKIEEDIVEAQPSCSSSSSGTPSNPSVPPGQKKQRRG